MRTRKIKRILKLIISLIFLILHRSILFFFKIFNIKVKGSHVVLYYHEIKSVHRKNFWHQMSMISKYTLPVRADYLTASAIEHRVAVTFDDAYQSVICNGIEAIYHFKIPVTIFIPTSYIGQHPQWDLNGSDGVNEEMVMSKEQLKKLSPEFVTFGSHTCTHPHLTKLNTKEIEVELKKSKLVIEKLIGKKINMLAFPHGEFNDKIVRIALDSGYKYVYTIKPEFPRQQIERAIIGRTPADPSDWGIEFWLKINGYYRWLSLPVYFKKFFREIFVIR